MIRFHGFESLQLIILIKDKVIQELENRTQLLKAEMEKNIALAKSLECDNKEKQAVIESLEKRLGEEINRFDDDYYFGFADFLFNNHIDFCQ